MWVLHWQNLVFAVSAAAIFWLVLRVYGFSPGSSQSPNTAYDGAGMIACLHDQGLASLTQWCHEVGQPIGTPLIMGLPQIYTGWVVSYLPGVDAWDANKIAMSLWVAVGLAGGYLCVRRWQASRWIALVASGLYLLSPSLVYLNGFAYTFIAFAIFPAYLAAALLLIDAFERGRRLWPAAGFVLLSLVMVFTDGYSFFGGALLIGVLALARAWRPDRSRRGAIWALGTFVVSLGVAAVSYRLYVPGTSYETAGEGLGVFRYLGLDLVTLFIPVKSLWFTQLFGMDGAFPALWGDGSNISSNYLGFIVLALIVWFVVRGHRRLDSSTSLEVRAVLLAGAFALVLSFGPDLKVYELSREVSPPWEVPQSMTTMHLPTSWLYSHVPGMTEMRATFRWFLVTRLTAVLGAGVALGALLRPPRRADGEQPAPRASGRLRWVRPAAVGLVLAAMCLETVVDIPHQLLVREVSAQRVDKVRNGIGAEAAATLRDGEQVLILPSVNDLLTEGVIPQTGATAFNVGGDKSYRLARSSWPPSIEAAAVAYPTGDVPIDQPIDAAADAVCHALETGDADVVMLPYMSFYFGALFGPDTSATDKVLKDRAALLAADPRFEAVPGTWMTLLRSSGAGCGAAT